MAENNFEDTFYIQSKLLKMVEPLMTEYFDFDSSMFLDEIGRSVKTRKDHIIFENGIPTVDYLKYFYNDGSLAVLAPEYPFKKDIADEFPIYFDFETRDEKTLIDHYNIYVALTYMGYAYYKQVNGLYDTSFLITALDIEYEATLHAKIYPEMLSLYKMILESKKKYKKQGDVITINYKGDKLDINTSGWFIDDMEKYFADRFPDLTLEKIEELLPESPKGGRRSKDPYTMIMIWGTYQLMKNHHSAFKDSKVAISKEMCQFILNYLDFCNIEHGFVDTDIKDNLKDMLKRGYTPKWNLPWRNVFSNIQEKQPESKLGKLNQPSRKYNLSNLL